MSAAARATSSLVGELIEYLSATTVLYPGDGHHDRDPIGDRVTRTPPQFLRPGDVVESWVDGIGDATRRRARSRSRRRPEPPPEAS